MGLRLRGVIVATCLAGLAAAAGPEPVAGTTWRLTVLGTAPFEVALGARAPYLTLDGATERFSARVACAVFSGRYVQDGAALRFEAIRAQTALKCDEALAAHDARMGRVLAATHRIRSTGAQAQLLDREGRVLATLAAP